MNRKDFKNLLDKTESKYLKCWQILSSFKKQRDKSIVLFQQKSVSSFDTNFIFLEWGVYSLAKGLLMGDPDYTDSLTSI